MKNAISLLKTSCKHFHNKLLMEKLTVVPTVVNHPEIDNLRGSSFNNMYKITSDNKLCQFSKLRHHILVAKNELIKNSWNFRLCNFIAHFAMNLIL